MTANSSSTLGVRRQIEPFAVAHPAADDRSLVLLVRHRATLPALPPSEA